MRKTISLMLACMLLIPCLAGCTAGAEQHTGEAEGYGGKLKVTVAMNGDDITSVKVTEHHETEGVGTRAIDALPAAIEKADSIDVDSVSGATVTSNAIKEAVSQAMGMSGVIQQVIPMDGSNATQASSISGLTGMGMASTGRVGPGKDSEGNQVYSFNVVFACGEFEEDGTIRKIKVDQLEVVTPNLGGGNAFSGFPEDGASEDFMQEIAAWQTKAAMGDSYMLTSGSWRDQMAAYEQAMVGKTVDEVKEWYANRGNSSAATGDNASQTTSETEVTDASDAGTALPVNDMADVPAADGAGQSSTAGQSSAAGQSNAASQGNAGGQNNATGATDAASGATMSLQSEYGDILLAIERAWEAARKNLPGRENTMVDTNTLTDAADGENNVG